MRVAVFGATGVIGRALLPLLAGHEVVAVSRSPRAEPGWAAADVATGDGVAQALDGADVAYYLVHSLGTRDFERRDRQAAANVSRAAARAGVRQIVYLGGLGGDDPGASAHLRSRRETGEVLGADGVPVTTLRAAMVVGRGSAAFETILGLVKRLPVMVTPSWVTTPTQPIALDDVAAYLAGVAGREDAFGRSYDVGGPEVMTYRGRADRRAPRPSARDYRGPRADACALGALARARHACERGGRPPARGGAAEPHGRSGRADPRSRARRAHAV